MTVIHFAKADEAKEVWYYAKSVLTSHPDPDGEAEALAIVYKEETEIVCTCFSLHGTIL